MLLSELVRVDKQPSFAPQKIYLILEIVDSMPQPIDLLLRVSIVIGEELPPLSCQKRSESAANVLPAKYRACIFC